MSALLAPRRLLGAPEPHPAAEAVRVCFMIDRLTRAGTESQLLALIRELDRSRVHPSLVLLDGEDDLSRALEPADCQVLRLGVRKLVSLSTVRATAGRQVQTLTSQTFLRDMEPVEHAEERPSRVADRLDEETRAALERLRRGES